MAGAVCLQGGHEFAEQCRDMDVEMLRVSQSGSVAVLAGAARRGGDYNGASKRACRHYEALGADVIVVPDPRDDLDAAVAALTEDIALLILPGGSPQSLRDSLSGSVEERVVALHHAGMSISGASAGAMVLCSQMVLHGGRPDIVDGLGLVDGLAFPHWTPGSDRGWPVPDDFDLWGLPECGGVIIEGAAMATTVRAVGEGEPSVFRDGSWRLVPRGASTPD